MSIAKGGSSANLTRRGILGGSLALAAGATLSACKAGSKSDSDSATSAAGGTPTAGKKVIFVVHEKNTFFAPVQKGFETFGKAAGWSTQFIGPPQFDQATVVNMMQNAVNAKPDGLILTRIDTTSYDGVIKAAQEAGIPVILSNVASDGYEKLGVGFVGQDFVPAGIAAGQQILQYIAKHTGRRDGAIIVGKIQAGNSALEQRGQGIKQAVRDFNSANGTNFTTEDLIVGTEEAGAVAKIDGRHARDPRSVVGWAGTAFECQFVATWARSKNLVGKFANGGFDMTSPVLAGIKDASIDYTIGQNPWAQGWVAASLLAQQIFPGYPSFHYDTGAEIVDSTNVAKVSAREAKLTS
ncbi:substrate-binding domain-containing protein [Embleya scabrispora]|uniref:substrate-binding domain-containing protein n=1 Tax=Embleya scabrispora TaxID=159449 RepID=UPI000369A571|nr:substrate-binding domain-containing protein [Embleya scabrispora]MYS81074.1 substrate-binding domain-containing protein [Streptomyces sp. SID5474]